MVDVKRKKGETFESFIRRFNKRIIQSGVLLQFKKIRFLEEKQSRNMNRTSSLRRKNNREKKEYLRKIGRLPEEPIFKGRR
jgi:ribosomal protein S21